MPSSMMKDNLYSLFMLEIVSFDYPKSSNMMLSRSTPMLYSIS